jgi:deoxyribose-phosphate aldolase
MDKIARYIDHTLLKPGTTEDQVGQLCREALEYGFASVCVEPAFIPCAANALKNSEVKAVAVVGFPTGLDATAAKVAQARRAVSEGAREIDMVINLNALKNKNYATLYEDVAAVVQACGPGVPVKAILETSELTREEKTAAGSLALAAGAAFLKTSTGFKGGATVEDVRLLRQIAGADRGVKASGGIRDLASARAMIEAGANRLGTSAGVAIVRGLSSEGGY